MFSSYFQKLPRLETIIFLPCVLKIVSIDITLKLENTCTIKKNFCINCHSHFMEIRPLIKSIVVSISLIPR